MLNLLSFLLVSLTLAQSASWTELIAKGDGKNGKTHRLLNAEFSKSSAPSYFEFFYSQVQAYEDRAVLSLQQKSTAEALQDENYKIYREFVLFAQRDSKLVDQLPASYLNNQKPENNYLLRTLFKDPNIEIRNGLARAFWDELIEDRVSTKDSYDHLQLFLQNGMKDDLLKTLKYLAKESTLASRFKGCNPAFWAISRLLDGRHIKDSGALTSALDHKEFLSKRLNETETLNNCETSKSFRDISEENLRKLITDSNFEKSFWDKQQLSESNDELWLQKMIVALSPLQPAKGWEAKINTEH